VALLAQAMDQLVDPASLAHELSFNGDDLYCLS